MARYPYDTNVTHEVLTDLLNEAETIAKEELGLDMYPNQLVIVNNQAMLDAYTSVALPVMYNHWSFGKLQVTQEKQFRAGQMGLAYEIVINSNPSFCYLKSDNPLFMQALVINHAACGHNHFFKNNYLFKKWTNAETILPFLNFAKKFVATCESIHGEETVERFLDSCHALQAQGVFYYERPEKANPKEELKHLQKLMEDNQNSHDPLWANTVPNYDTDREAVIEETRLSGVDRINNTSEGEENLLYFFEKSSPFLPQWKRELIRIVRVIAQYFYPQGLTQVNNEGFATAVHNYLTERMFEKDIIDHTSMERFIKSNGGVILQPSYKSEYYSGFNPYYLGYNIFCEIRRVCEEPTDEDKKWFKHRTWFKEGHDWKYVWKYAAEEHSSAEFIMQFLTPALIRKMKAFEVKIDTEQPYVEVTATHNESYYRQIKKTLANSYLRENSSPQIQIVNVNAKGDHTVTLHHKIVDGVWLRQESAVKVLKHASVLNNNYPVVLEGVSPDGEVQYRITSDGDFEDFSFDLDLDLDLSDEFDETSSIIHIP